QPKRGEIGVAILREDALYINLDPRGAREAGVVADDAECDTVADDAPEGALLRVQVLLREAEGAPLAAPIAECCDGRVEPAFGRGDDHRHAPTERRMTDGVRALRKDNGSHDVELREPERVFEEPSHETLG